MRVYRLHQVGRLSSKKRHNWAQANNSSAHLWRRGGKNITQRLLHHLETKVDKQAAVEKRVSNLANSLDLDALTEATEKALKVSKTLFT